MLFLVNPNNDCSIQGAFDQKAEAAKFASRRATSESVIGMKSEKDSRQRMVRSESDFLSKLGYHSDTYKCQIAKRICTDYGRADERSADKEAL